MTITKKLFLCINVVLCSHLVHSQSQPIVVVDNLTVTHEQNGWRVIDASTTPIHFNLIKGDLIVRIDGKNAAESGPMTMASLFNQGDRRQIHLFIERGPALGTVLEVTVKSVEETKRRLVQNGCEIVKD